MTYSTTFSAGTVVTSNWLNAVNDSVLDDVINVKRYGAVGDDSTDDTAAIQAAFDAVSDIGGVVYFPTGRYKVTSTLVITKDLTTLQGDGPRQSTIRVFHDAGNAITVQHATSPGTVYLNGFCMFNMGIRARQLTTGNALLELNKAQDVFIDNVAFEDHFGGVHLKGGGNVYMNNFKIFAPRTTAPISWTGVQAGSYFMKLAADGNGVGVTEMFVNNFNFRRTETTNYIEHGIVISACDGVWFNNGHIMGVDQADMYVTPVAGTEQISGIKCTAVWFDNNAKYGVWITGSTSALYAPIELVNCDFLTHSVTSVFVDTAATMFEGIRMIGGWVRKAQQFGLLLRAGANHLIQGVDFGACNTNGTASVAAISVGPDADHVQILGNSFKQTGFGVTATGMLGIFINAGAVTDVIINNNYFDLTAIDITDNSTNDSNNFSNNHTTKSVGATAVSGTSLLITEMGDSFYVTAGLNFDNMTGRWNQRKVTLIFAGASTVTHGSGGILLSGSVNKTFKAGDTLTLLYSPDLSDWIEVTRMIS